MTDAVRIAALGIGGPLLALYGLWLMLRPDWVIDTTRRQIERKLRSPPGFWQKWQLARLESRGYRLQVRLSGAGGVLFGAGMAAAAGRMAGLW